MVEHLNVVDADSVSWSEQSDGEGFGHRRKPLGSTAGGRGLGCSLYEVPPGKKAWPYHYHLGNEEAVYVLEGQGILRIGGQKVRLSAGCYAALPAGEEGAHQVINTSELPLRYLCFSTMAEPDILVYPDSSKVGIFAGSAPGGPKEKRTLNKYLRADAEVDYYDGEE